MRIDINQKKIAFANSYNIYKEGDKSHTAKVSLFTVLSLINLYKKDTKNSLLSIQKRLSWFTPNYDIRFQDNSIATFRTESIWSHRYICKYKGDTFYVYKHNGRKCSIFKNNEQIAWWDKDGVVWFSGDNYKIVADYDINFELIVALCLIIDNYFKRRKNNILTYDFGNLRGQDLKFNDTWNPKEPITIID